MKPVLISGFPGVGKTHACQACKDIWRMRDLDSSDFHFTNGGNRDVNPAWPGNYIRRIESLLDESLPGGGECDIVFVSSHREVRDLLEDNRIPYVAVQPRIGDKELYRANYLARGSGEKFTNTIMANWDLWVPHAASTRLFEASPYLDENLIKQILSFWRGARFSMAFADNSRPFEQVNSWSHWLKCRGNKELRLIISCDDSAQGINRNDMEAFAALIAEAQRLLLESDGVDSGDYAHVLSSARRRVRFWKESLEHDARHNRIGLARETSMCLCEAEDDLHACLRKIKLNNK